VEGGGACRSMQTEWMDEMEILGGMVRIDDVAGTLHAVDWRDKSEILFVTRELKICMYSCHLSSNYSVFLNDSFTYNTAKTKLYTPWYVLTPSMIDICPHGQTWLSVD
jgi:hypothetical protein